MGGIKIVYDYPTTINTSNGIGAILTYVNDVTNSWASNMLLIAIYIIILISYYKAKEDFGGAIAVAGFGLFVVGMLFWMGGFIGGLTFSVVVAICIVGIVVILLDKS